MKKQYYDKKVSDTECHCKWMDGARLGNCPYCESQETKEACNHEWVETKQCKKCNYYEYWIERPAETSDKNIKGWEQEFDKICFYEEEASMFENPNPEKPFNIKRVNAEHIGDVQSKLIPEIKNFIRTLLSAQRSNLVKEIDGLRDIRTPREESERISINNYNHAINSVINLINSSK